MKENQEKHEIYRIAEELGCEAEFYDGTASMYIRPFYVECKKEGWKDALLKKLQDIVCPDYAKLQAKVQEMESWKPDEDSYLCGYQQAVLNSTGIIVSPNEGAGSFSRWLQRLSQRTSPPTENHYAEKLVNLNRQIESLQSELSALKAQSVQKLEEAEKDGFLIGYQMCMDKEFEMIVDGFNGLAAYNEWKNPPAKEDGE